MRNAGRLLEVQTIGGVETLAVAGYNRADNESLASSTSSGAMMPGGFGIESRAGSPRPQQMGPPEHDSTGGKAAAGGSSEGLFHKTPPMTGDETELMECRIRRLEGGRMRAERARRAASSRRIARVAKEQRKMLLTGDAEALASSKSSLEALLSITQGAGQASQKDGPPPTVAGLEKAHILALRDRVVLELSERDSNRLPQRRRGSVEVIVETIRRGSVQLRRGSVKLVAEVKDRTLKRPISQTKNGDRDDDGQTGQPSAQAGTYDKGGENRQEAKRTEDDGVLLSSLEDDAVAPALCNSAEQDEAGGQKEDALGENAGGVGVVERKHLTLDSPGNVTEKGGSPEQQQQHQQEQQRQQQQKRQRPVTRSPRTKVLEDEERSSVTLEELLAAVDGLSQKVQQEEAPIGAAAYAAWWLGAVSAPELELKKRFLTPGPMGSLWWGKGSS